MKRLLLLILFAFVAVTTIQAQESEIVTLELKSGHIVSGQVVSEDGSSMTIRTAEGDLFIYHTNDVMRVKRGEGRPASRYAVNADTNDSRAFDQTVNREYQKTVVAREREQAARERAIRKEERSERPVYGSFRGFRSYLELLTYSADIGGDIADRFSLATYVGGYSFGPCLYLGLGFGLALTDVPFACELDFPLFLHVRSTFLKHHRLSPFASFSVGGNLGATEYKEAVGFREYNYYDYTGAFIEPTIGVELRSKKSEKKTSFYVGLTFPMVFSDYYLISMGAKIGFSF